MNTEGIAVQNPRKEKILKRLNEHYNYLVEKGYTVVGLFLQGSQNYELDTELSDIDSKAIILPSFENFVNGDKIVSTTLELENKEHVDIKDIRVMFDTLQKCNVNFVEILFTQYRVLNIEFYDLIKPLLDNAERLAMWNKKALYNCIVGMSKQKYVALKHPYPTILHKIEKFGYDPKQLHHILRMNEFYKRLLAGESFKDCLIAKDIEYLINVKYGLYDLKTAEILAKQYDDETYALKEQHINDDIIIDNEALSIYKEVKLNILKKHFKKELGENYD